MAGNIQAGTIASAKKQIITKYLSTGLYRRVRMLDDDIANIKMFVNYGDNMSSQVIDKVMKKYNISNDERLQAMTFYALLVKPNGSLKRIK